MSGWVMVVDDDQDILEVVCSLLVAEGYPARPVNNASDALRLLQGDVDKPSLILMDLHMPHMDGHQVTRKLRSVGLDIPVLLMTADHDAATKMADLPVAALLEKPFDVDELLVRVKRYCG